MSTQCFSQKAHSAYYLLTGVKIKNTLKVTCLYAIEILMENGAAREN